VTGSTPVGLQTVRLRKRDNSAAPCLKRHLPAGCKRGSRLGPGSAYKCEPAASNYVERQWQQYFRVWVKR
jgi:hypothetical protein